MHFLWSCALIHFQAKNTHPIDQGRSRYHQDHIVPLRQVNNANYSTVEVR